MVGGPRREIDRPHDGYALIHDGFSGAGQFAVSSLFGRQVDDDRSRP